MIHYGDICKLNGNEIPTVDVITGGSPCQDLSVAGKRAGMKHEGKGDEETTRSGLFIEQIRIIKEMREHDRAIGRADEYIRPRFMVWENVPGALSSGTPKGEDFRIVLEEIARVNDPAAVIPGPEDGKWTNAGCIVADWGSVAWRICDAQFWGSSQFVDGRMWLSGTPQRRRRIALVADFGGYAAPEVLFESKSVFGDFKSGGTKGQSVTAGTEGCPGEAIPIEGNGSRESHRGSGYGRMNDPMFTLNSVENHSVASFTFKIRSGCEVDSHGKKAGKGILVQNELAATVAAVQDQFAVDGGRNTVYGISPYDSGGFKSSNPHSGIYRAETARTLDNNGGLPACNQGGMAILSKV